MADYVETRWAINEIAEEIPFQQYFGQVLLQLNLCVHFQTDEVKNMVIVFSRS
jgi:hypothetical protein